MSSQSVFPRDASRESPHFGPSPGRGRVSLEGLSTGGAVHEPLDPISVIRPRVAGNKPQVSGITSAEAMSRGRALCSQKSLDLAALCFEEALQIDPCNISAYFNSAQCAFDLGKFAIARQHLEMVIEIDPHMGLAHLALGQIYLQDGMIESAMASSECALKLLADDERATAFRATVLQFSGDGKAAWKLVRAMIDRGIKSPQLVAFHAELAFKNNRSETAIKLLDEVLAMPGLSSWEEALLRYSAAGLLDRLGRYDEAFAQANRANFLRQPSFNMVKHEREIDNLIAYFSSRRLRCLPKASYRDAKPVFVVGMPRSGTSLTEQILASHPDVYGAGELDFISRVFEGTLDMLGSPVSEYPGCLDRLSVDRADDVLRL